MTDRLKVQFVIGRERISPAIVRPRDENRLVILLPWDQSPATTLDALHDLLTEVERVEVAAALDDGRGHELA